VIHLDASRFPTTDIVVDGATLPFVEDSFDAVFSFSVLEHVKDPHQVAREIKRVTKPGGIIQVSAPHLIQYHGHPDHYFNPTYRGLEILFGDDVEILVDETPTWGHPIWGVTEILQEWAAALPKESADEFLRASVSDLLKSPAELFRQPYIRDLDLGKARGIATNNFLIARKVR
jgi:SAM-dependent methyltransferase